MKKIIPHFTVPDAGATIDYYSKSLGFAIDHAQRDDSGKATFAILSHSAVEIMISEDESAASPATAESAPIIPPLVLYVDMNDVDDYYARVKDNSNIVRRLDSTPWGTREFWVRDNNGNTFAFFSAAST